MSARNTLFALTCLSAMAVSLADDSPGTVRLVTTRKFGYVIGDLVAYDAVITVDPSWTLRTSSLPTPGRPEYWLELRQVTVGEARAHTEREYHVHLLYQLFYAPIEARTRDLPGFVLEFAHQGASSRIGVPALVVTMSPLREVATGTGDPEENVALAPDRATAGVPLRRPLIGIAATAALTLCMALLLAWQRAIWPFARRTGPPFTRAERALRKSDPGESKNYATALLGLHRAFDATAGWRVFADDVPRFLVEHPQFAGAAAEIGRFFTASRYQFFGVDVTQTSAEFPPDALRKLSHRLAVMERGV
jgi:mxaA protein